VDDDLLRKAGEAAGEQVDPVSDARGSSDYKRDLVRVSLIRGIRQCMAGSLS
jgi:CO/xanthine dehydrogenase FAD-binding subunit